MKKIIPMLFIILTMSCSLAAERDIHKFYYEYENKSQLDIVLTEKELQSLEIPGGVEVIFPVFLKTKITAQIKSLVYNATGLLIKQRDNSEISFIYESSEEIFFIEKGKSLLEVYSDIFTKNLDTIKDKYNDSSDSMRGMLDFKLALPIKDAVEKGYFLGNDFLIYFLIGNKSSQAFVFDKNLPDQVLRVSSQGFTANEFISVLSSISKVN